MNVNLRDLAIGLALIAAAAVVPFLTGSAYDIKQITLFFLWATVVTQWNLVYGVAGIFSLAQMALFAVGAYAAAMLLFYLNWSPWLAMPMAGLVAVVVSMLIGLACLRLRGPYVALLTLAVAQVIYVYIITDTDCFLRNESGCQQLFGGTTGLNLRKAPGLGFREWLGGDWYVGHYFLALAILVLATIFSIVLIRGPLGLAFQALRDNPGYALARGISRFKYQLWVFALSAFFTGLAGAFYAINNQVAGPTVLTSFYLLFPLAMLVVGGAGSTWGPILGAALLMLVDEELKDIGEYRNIGFGVLILLFAILLPQGLAGVFKRARGR